MTPWLQQLRIGHRLALGFGLVLALFVGLAGVSAWQLSRIQHNVDYFSSDLLPSLTALKGFTQAVDEARRMDWQVGYLDNDADRLKSEQRMLAARKKANELIERYAATLASSDEDRQLLAKARSALDAYSAVQDRIVAASRLRAADPTQNQLVKTLVAQDARSAFNALTDASTAWWEFNNRLAANHTATSQSLFQQVMTLTAAFTAMALLIGVAGAWLLTRSITAPLGVAVALTQRVAHGDLSPHPRSNARDEVGTLMGALCDMNEQLGRTVSDIRQGADAIATASAQIAQGNSDLSARTEQQASGLQQTAASVEELSGTARTSADNARQANQLAGRASEVAIAGGAAVQDVVQTMGEIQTASRRIADIIGVIDGIAFQTNILALNAAVEAARAGEQGRGFAVVAGEVRSLAQRSADAAREIKGLIGSSVERVEAGGAMVGRAGQTIGDVVEQVRKVSDLIGEISAASIEQDSGVGQINQAIVSLDQATQQNAALVEQTAAAAESLRQQAERLSRSVAVFRTDSLASVPVRHAPPPAPASRPSPAPRASAPAPSSAPASAMAAAPAALAGSASATDSDWETF